MVDQFAIYHLTEIRQHIKALLTEFAPLDIMGTVGQMVAAESEDGYMPFFIMIHGGKTILTTSNMTNKDAIKFFLEPVLEEFKNEK